jgi:hypothetical protein
MHMGIGYPSDTDVIVMAVSKQSLLDPEAVIITGTGEPRWTILLKPFNNALGEEQI